MNTYTVVETNGILGKYDEFVKNVFETGNPGYFNPSNGFISDVWESLNQKLFGSNDALARGFARGLAGVRSSYDYYCEEPGSINRD